MEKPEVWEDIREGGRQLVRKWGPRDVLVIISVEDHRRIDRYMKNKHGPGGTPEPEGPSFSFKFQTVKGLSQGDFILSIEDDKDQGNDVITI